jgi:hypothetical protein
MICHMMCVSVPVSLYISLLCMIIFHLVIFLNMHSAMLYSIPSILYWPNISNIIMTRWLFNTINFIMQHLRVKAMVDVHLIWAWGYLMKMMYCSVQLKQMVKYCFIFLLYQADMRFAQNKVSLRCPYFRKSKYCLV